MSLKRWILCGLGAAVLIVGFQNCARPGDAVFEDLELSSLKNFFNYPYKTAPKFFGQVFLFQSPQEVGLLDSFRVVGMASYLTSPTAVVTYEVRVFDKDGFVVCPTHTGTLTPPASAIEFDCVTTRSTALVRVQMSLSAGSDQVVFQENFGR